MRIAKKAVLHGLIILTFTLTLLLPNVSAEDIHLPDTLNPAMEHLLSMVDPSAGGKVDERLAATLLDYMSEPKEMQGTYTMGMKKGAVSNYYEFNFQRSFQDVMDLVYSPEIPSYITIPSSVRRSHWVTIDGKQEPLPRLSQAWPQDGRPRIIRGLEFVENTPDTYSGAYYAYDQDRTLILMTYQGRRVLLSISRQRDKSTVGKKGLVLGEDEEWNYLYTGEKGCTRKGLGWVDSYMYRAESIMIYYEVNEPSPQVKCAVFKWLHAGWAGINMVQPSNIRDGIQRFAKAFKTIVEAPGLPAHDQLASDFRRIENLSIDMLRQKARDHFKLLRSKYEHSSNRNKKWFQRLFNNDAYFKGLQREELQALLSNAYMRFLLGKDQGLDISSLTQEKRPG